MNKSQKLYTSAKEYLQKEFDSRQKRRPSYSLRAFARDLKMSAASLNDLMKDRSGFSKKRALDVAQILQLTETETEHFIDLLNLKYSPHLVTQKSSQARIEFRQKSSPSYFSAENFKFISEWYHLAILEIITIYKGHISEHEISRHLKIPTSKIKKAIERLVNLGLVVDVSDLELDIKNNIKNNTKNEDTNSKKFEITQAWTHISSEKHVEAIKEFHLQMLDIAKVKMNEDDFQKREGLSAVISIDANDFMNFRNEVFESLNSIMMKYTSISQKNRVVGLNMSTFIIMDKNNEKIE